MEEEKWFRIATLPNWTIEIRERNIDYAETNITWLNEIKNKMKHGVNMA